MVALVAALLAPGAGWALPSDPATSCGIANFREKALREINAARTSGRSCGTQWMGPAPPLVWNQELFFAAAGHSSDMAQHDYFDHVDRQGRRVGARVTAEGYPWRSVGENIAGGDGSVDRAMRGWIASPGHCRNIMDTAFTEVGIACVERSGTTWGTYWTMVLGRRA
jgi:uncharacterized protein YkwD